MTALNGSTLMGMSNDDFTITQIEADLDIAQTRLNVAKRDLSIAVRALTKLTESGGHAAIVAKQALDSMVMHSTTMREVAPA